MLELLPGTAAVKDGELAVGRIRVSALAEEFGTPLAVYCEQTLLGRAHAYTRAAPGALVAYSVKVFPNVAVLRFLAAEGLGADVSTLGELPFAQRAAVPGERIVVHGNNKSDEGSLHPTPHGLRLSSSRGLGREWATRCCHARLHRGRVEALETRRLRLLRPGDMTRDRRAKPLTRLRVERSDAPG